MHCSHEAKAIADRQRYYDRLHQLMRIEWLESEPYLDHFHNHLLIQSRLVLQDESGMSGYNSCDTEDAEYLKELDAFAAARQAA